MEELQITNDAWMKFESFSLLLISQVLNVCLSKSTDISNLQNYGGELKQIDFSHSCATRVLELMLYIVLS